MSTLVPVPMPSPFAHNIDSQDHRLDELCLIERAVREAFEFRVLVEAEQALQAGKVPLGFPGAMSTSRRHDGTYLRPDLQETWRAFRRGFYLGASWAEGNR